MKTFRVSAVELDDATGVRLLLHKLSLGFQKRYAYHFLPRHLRGVPFEETIQFLVSCCSRKPLSSIWKWQRIKEKRCRLWSRTSRECQWFLLLHCSESTSDTLSLSAACTLFIGGSHPYLYPQLARQYLVAATEQDIWESWVPVTQRTRFGNSDIMKS